MAAPSRMQIARRRLRVARYSIAAVAATSFAAFGFAVRDAHPATHASTPSAAAATPSVAGGSSSPAVISPAPQAVAPMIQSAGS